MGSRHDRSRLMTAVVLATDEESCELYSTGSRFVAPYAPQFPRPRSDRVSPGHLAAVLSTAEHGALIVWRWFDAVVLDTVGNGVRLWEPLHGELMARLRDPAVSLRPGSRAYVSAGLPGADWWLAGPVVDCPEQAEVDGEEVLRFYDGLGDF